MHHLKQYSVILILEKVLLNGPYAEIHIMFPHATARSSTIADVAEFVNAEFAKATTLSKRPPTPTTGSSLSSTLQAMLQAAKDGAQS